MADDTLTALNEIQGASKPDDIGMGEWIWEALQGDFNTERSAGQIGFDMVVSLIPVVDTICDVRDLVANVRQYRKDPSNKVVLFFIATTVVGFFPELGTVAKSVLRLTWVYLKPLIKHADDITDASKLIAATKRACDAALPKITEYLQHNRVAKWATAGKLPDVYKFVAKTIREAAEKINPATLTRYLNEKLDELKSLLAKIRALVPTGIREQVDDLLKLIDPQRRAISNAIQQFAQPIRTVLKVVAKRLDDQAWRVEIHRTNRGWISPISESGSAKLINGNPPAWVTRKTKGLTEFPPVVYKKKKVQALMDANPKHPNLQEWMVKTFSRKGGGIKAATISGPAKLYRIVDPSNEAAGVFWISEAEFKAIRNRDEWRSKFAVKPEWNQNGWYVEYEIKKGESLNVWSGPTSSQKLAGTNYYLVGGREQIVFVPTSRDEMVSAMPRIEGSTGSVVVDSAGKEDRRVEFVDLTGELVPTKIRSRITDPRIKGPLETGWGATDYTQQQADRIVLTAPAP